MKNELTLPVISLKEASCDEASFAKQVGDALAHVGFFSLVDHGMTAEEISNTYASVKAFFALPESEKQKCERPDISFQRGRTPFGKEIGKGAPLPDLKEFYHVGPPSDKGDLVNVWPEAGEVFARDQLNLYRHMERIAGMVLRGCSIYMGENPEFLEKCLDGGPSILRSIHYPPLGEGAGEAVRAAAHEDINLITLMVTAEETGPTGLEILCKDGFYRGVAVPAGSIVIDAGDMLQNISNGLFKSTTHRVINPPMPWGARPRYSMPFFAHAHPEFDLSPRPSAIGKTGGKIQYRNISAHAYLMERLREIGLARK